MTSTAVRRLLTGIFMVGVLCLGSSTSAVSAANDVASQHTSVATVLAAPGTDSPLALTSSVASLRVSRASWNPNVKCRAVVTTLAKVLGNRQNANGGATYHGGGFKPGIPDRRAFHPPCNVNGHHTFVQLNGVETGSCAKINDDGDWTCGLWDPTPPAGRPYYLNHIHIETDQKFRAARGWSVPPGGTPMRVQGFVFWDPNHVGEKWHFYSGWELHSFTAWKPAVH